MDISPSSLIYHFENLKLRICDICVTVNCLLLNMEVKIVQWQSVGPKSITIT